MNIKIHACLGVSGTLLLLLGMGYGRQDATAGSIDSAPLTGLHGLVNNAETSAHGRNVLAIGVNTSLNVSPPQPTGAGGQNQILPSADYKVMQFGSVVAIAPVSMTVLTTNPALFNVPDSQLASLNPTQFLFSTLTAGQFDQLSTSGLSIADLSEPQQAIFREMLPVPFLIEPAGSPEVEGIGGAVVTVPQEQVLSQVRLHAYLDEDFIPDTPDGSFELYSTQPDVNYSSGSMRLLPKEVESGNFKSGATQLASLMSSLTPNVPKPGDVNWSGPELAAKVAITDQATVGSLVDSIAKATHLSLYVDARYGGDSVVLASSHHASPAASDLMQALALCVCGTWRETGPSTYILTDDLSGFGTRQQFLRDVESSWIARYTRIMWLDTGAHMQSLGWMSKLSPFPDATPKLSKGQLLSLFGNTDGSIAHTTWIDLPPPVQAALLQSIKAAAASEEEARGSTIDLAILKSISSATDFGVNIGIKTALEMPSTGAMSFKDVVVFKSPVSTAGNPRLNARTAVVEDPRGVICAPETPLEARQAVDALPGLGLNTLFIDVFNNGRGYFPNSAIPPVNAADGDVLGAALLEAARLNIAVYAVADTLDWNKEGGPDVAKAFPPGFDHDLNVLGEPSGIGVERRLGEGILGDETPTAQELIDEEATTSDWVSPLDPQVLKVLPALLAQLAATPGLSGLILQDTAPPGYGGESAYLGELEDPGIELGLGYTPSIRAAFIDAYHVDPIDIGGETQLAHAVNKQWSGPPFDFSVPGYDSGSKNSYGKFWSAYLEKGDQSFLSDCYLAVHTANPDLPVLLRDPALGTTVKRLTGPSASGDNSQQRFGDPNDGRTILCFPAVCALRITPDSFTSELDDERQQLGSNKPVGVAFDLETGARPGELLKMLQQLSQFIEPAVQR